MTGARGPCLYQAHGGKVLSAQPMGVSRPSAEGTNRWPFQPLAGRPLTAQTQTFWSLPTSTDPMHLQPPTPYSSPLCDLSIEMGLMAAPST